MAKRTKAFFLALLYSWQAIVHATRITGANQTPESTGGQRFDSVMGIDGALAILVEATNLVQLAFTYRDPNTPRKSVDTIAFTVDDMDGVAYEVNNQIHLSARYVGGFGGNVYREIRGILFHEMTHVWQWFGVDGNRPPQGLIEGIADFVRLKARMGVSGNGSLGSGSKWDEGYAVTALFLDYINTLYPAFVSKLNAKLATGWSESFFQDLTGKSVEQLWSEYKAKYNRK